MIEPEPELATEPAEDHGTLVQTIFEQASPFADELNAALTAQLATPTPSPVVEEQRPLIVEPEPVAVVELVPVVEEVSETETETEPDSRRSSWLSSSPSPRRFPSRVSTVSIRAASSVASSAPA